jgi:hypothetical protein
MKSCKGLALEEVIGKYGCPDIFNTDQSNQFTTEVFTNRLIINVMGRRTLGMVAGLILTSFGK